jgi:hypothetical protein
VKIFAKNNTSQHLRYYYVITEIGKPEICRWYSNSDKTTDIIVGDGKVKEILILIATNTVASRFNNGPPTPLSIMINK